MANKKDTKRIKKILLISAGVTVGLVALFLIISRFIVVDKCAPSPTGSCYKNSDGLLFCDAYTVCSERTLYDVIITGLSTGTWK